MLNRAIAPEFNAIDGIELITPQEYTFDNGLKAFVFHSADQELVRMEWIFKNKYNSDENPMLNTCLSSMVKEGTASFNSAEIADKVDFYGAYLMPEYAYDHSSLTLYTLNKHASVLLSLIKEVVSEATFPQKELDTYIRNNKQKLQVSLQKNDYIARRYFYNHIFGKNRYGRTPDLSDYENLTREALISLYQEQYQPDNCTLVISGHVSADLLDQINEIFVQNWPKKSSPNIDREPVFQTEIAKLIVEEKPEALQSAIRLGYPTINRTHADYPALQFVNTLFGGYFGSRLMKNIREEKGYTYGIGSAVASLSYTGFFTIATEVGAEVTQATLTEIEKEFFQLRNTLADVEEVELVKNYMSGSMLGSLESIFSHADKFKSVFFAGMDLAYYENYMQVVKNMTPEKVQEIALTYFDYDKLLKIVVGKMEESN